LAAAGDATPTRATLKARPLSVENHLVGGGGGQAGIGAGPRHAGWLFVAAGLIGTVNDIVPGTVGHGRPLAYAFNLLSIAIGITALCAPWNRWPARATIVLPLVGLAEISVNLAHGLLPVETYGVWLVLVFVWIGEWHTPRTVLLMGPPAALAYLLPSALGATTPGTSFGAITIAVPVAVLVGATIARKAEATRRAQAGQAEAITALALANLTDDLTGLGNRRRADLLLGELEDGDALAMLDLDHFKGINDTSGHQKGDEVLHALGAYLRDAVRGADRVARFGGEEFVVILRGAGSSAPATIDRLLSGWRATKPLTTLSAGLASHRAGQTYDVTLADADAALYEAKESGRDRLVVHHPGAGARHG
jgi:diguanylate cyclase (GGDEF)-like protein